MDATIYNGDVEHYSCYALIKAIARIFRGLWKQDSGGEHKMSSTVINFKKLSDIDTIRLTAVTGMLQ